MKNFYKKQLPLIFAAILIVASVGYWEYRKAENAQATTFGYTTIGNTSGDSSLPQCSKFTAPSTGAISTITFYTSGSSNTAVAAIYSDNAGAINTKLATSSNNVSVGTAGWYSVNISYTVTSGTVYWLCNWGSSSNFTTYYSNSGGTNQYVASIVGNTYPTWNTTLSTLAYSNDILSIYATYSNGGSVTIKPQMILFQ